MKKKQTQQTQQQTQKTHITVDELAQRWSISSISIRRMVWSGELKATYFGRAIRIPVEEIDRYLRGKEGSPA